MEYTAALTQLDLFAGKKLSRLANTLHNQDMAVMDAAGKGKNPEKFKHETGQEVLPTEVTAAMQEELQLTDGVPIDPVTGLRVWNDSDGSKDFSPPS
jgi:hypothetical protein